MQHEAQMREVVNALCTDALAGVEAIQARSQAVREQIEATQAMLCDQVADLHTRVQAWRESRKIIEDALASFEAQFAPTPTPAMAEAAE